MQVLGHGFSIRGVTFWRLRRGALVLCWSAGWGSWSSGYVAWAIIVLLFLVASGVLLVACLYSLSITEGCSGWVLVPSPLVGRLFAEGVYVG